jgi:hypothetical protein
MSSVFYTLLKWITITTLPALLVLLSVNYQMSDPNLYKNTLVKDNFYPQLSTEIKNLKTPLANQSTVANLIDLSILDTVSESPFLQKLAEKNVDQTTNWLSGQTDTWMYYLPTQELDTSIKQNLDQKSTEIAEKNLLQTPTCTREDLLQIPKVGFDTSKPLCLPEAVKNRSMSLSTFLGINDQKDTFTSLMRDTPLNTKSTVFSVYDSIQNEKGARTIYQYVLNIRNAFVTLRNTTPIAWTAILGIFIILLLLAWRSGLNILLELKRITRNIGINTIIFAAIFVIAVAGSVLTGGISTIIIPGFHSTGITTLLTSELAKLSYLLVEPALFAGAGFILLSFIFTILHFLYIKNISQYKNEKVRLHLKQTRI